MFLCIQIESSRRRYMIWASEHLDESSSKGWANEADARLKLADSVRERRRRLGKEICFVWHITYCLFTTDDRRLDTSVGEKFEEALVHKGSSSGLQRELPPLNIDYSARNYRSPTGKNEMSEKTLEICVGIISVRSLHVANASCDTRARGIAYVLVLVLVQCATTGTTMTSIFTDSGSNTARK